MNIPYRVYLLVCIIFILCSTASAARENNLIPVLFAETDTGIALYGLDEQNELSEIGHLPDNISLEAYDERQDNDPQKLWLSNWWNMNVVLSPDNAQIALTAERFNENGIDFNLFLVDVASGSLRLAHNEQWSGHPRADLRWSPDSQFVLIEPVYGDSGIAEPPYPETFVYNTADEQVTQFANLLPGMVWSSDGSGLVRMNKDNALISFNPYDGSQQVIGQVDNNLVNHGGEGVQPLCDFVWSPEQQSWYFIAACGTAVDGGEQVYSMGVNGDIALEGNLIPSLALELGVSEAEASIGYLDIHTLYAYEGDFYAAFEIHLPVREGFVDQWELVRILAPEQTETIFRYLPPDFITYSEAVPSPNNQFAAFMADTQIVMANLETGITTQEISRLPHDYQTNYWRYKIGRWIDDSSFLYEDMTDVWLFDASTQQLINLTADMNQTAWLLPQTISYQSE